MATTNSIALGKSKGSIGNVTLNRLKGQQIAKAKITSTTNVNSAGQVTSRSKMSNIVMAWQFLYLFMANAKALRKPTESVYNAFVRIFKTLTSAIIADSASMAAGLLAGVEAAAGNFIKVTGLTSVGAVVVVAFETGGLPFVINSYVSVIAFDSVAGNQTILSRVITEAEWNAGTLTTTQSTAGSDTMGGYIFNAGKKKCSNIVFASI